MTATIKFNLLEKAFFTDIPSLEKHTVIVKKKENFSVVDKDKLKRALAEGAQKVSLSKILCSLYLNAKNDPLNTSELEAVFKLSRFFTKKINNNKFTWLNDVKEIFSRFQNAIHGCGFKTHSQLIQQTEKLLYPRILKSNAVGGFIAQDFWASMNSHRNETCSQFGKDPDFKVIKNNFNEFCREVEATKNIENLNHSIPPIIHFVWLGSAVPEKVNGIIESWRKNCLGFEIKVWTDKDVKDFPWINLKAFNEAKTWAEKADIWRYEILYREGGIYSDTDVVCMRSFKDLISHGIDCFAGQEANKIYRFIGYGKCLYVCNAVFGAAKNSPVMKYCIDNLKTASQSSKHLVVRTGPVLLSKAFHEALNSSQSKKYLVLPCSYFYPLPYSPSIKKKKLSMEKIKSDYVDPESFVVHLWDASWEGKAYG